MRNVIEISYTGDLLAHRRCPRAWAYEKYAGFHPYEQVQAMEGRLIHHAMEWLCAYFARETRHANRSELEDQLKRYFRVLWARGIRTTFASKKETIERILDNLLPNKAAPDRLHPTVRAAIEGAQHTEYELRTVKKLVALHHDGKERLLLTGILDLVIQQQNPLQYERLWKWKDKSKLTGEVREGVVKARSNDLEIWDYKGSRGDSPYMRDYVLQLLTYANLYRERTGKRPERCVLFFINEKKRKDQLVAIPLDDDLLNMALDWTIERVKDVQKTMRAYQADPCGVDGGDYKVARTGKLRVSESLTKQCTACGRRFDCESYKLHLGGLKHPDIDLLNVRKN
ncbi:MAG: PD-(D/E)XK nuclease family protein [Planctomycetes bacterium]|nr:PD-(D/E)XK nuclease family protein [Planctomycetota bacterium]